MSFFAFVLIATSAGLHAAWSLLAKKERDPEAERSLAVNVQPSGCFLKSGRTR